MALPVVVAEAAIADELVATLVRLMGELKIGPAYDKSSQLGPLVNAEHRQSVIKWIEKGVEEGATLALDGRGSRPCRVREWLLPGRRRCSTT